MSIRLSSAQIVRIKDILAFHHLTYITYSIKQYERYLPLEKGLEYFRHNEVESLVEDILKEVLPTCLTNTPKTQNEPQSVND